MDLLIKRKEILKDYRNITEDDLSFGMYNTGDTLSCKVISMIEVSYINHLKFTIEHGNILESNITGRKYIYHFEGFLKCRNDFGGWQGHVSNPKDDKTSVWITDSDNFSKRCKLLLVEKRDRNL